MRLVLGTEAAETSTAAQIRAHGSDGVSNSANGIRYTASDAAVVGMPVEPPVTARVPVAAAVVVVDIGKHISAVREEGKRQDAGGRTTVGTGAEPQNMARRFAGAIEPLEERLRDVL